MIDLKLIIKPLNLSFFLFLIIYFSATYSILHLSYGLILPFILFSILIQREILIVFYLILLPTAGVIPTEYNLIDAIGLDEIINVFCLLYFYFFYRNNKKSKETIIQNIAISIVNIILVVIIITNLKNSLFGMYGSDFFLVFKRTIFLIIRFLPLYFIIKNINHYKIYRFTKIGIYLSLIILVVSQYLTPILLNIGLYVLDHSEFVGLADNIEGVNRFSGFYNGDSNSIGAYLNMIIGYIFIQLEYKKISKKLAYTFIGIGFFGILLTASRAAFVSFAFILFLFLIFSKSSKNIFKVIFLFLTMTLVFSDFLLNQLSRFHNAHYQIDTNIDGNRIMKWAHYLSFMWQNPIYYITGAQSEINNRAAHNVFIQMMYNVGVFPMLLFIKRIFFSFRVAVKKNKRAWYFIIPLFNIMMFVSELKELNLYVLLFILFFIDFDHK
tara:strand:+ start:463 stop:1779 length:1317 start_codon:yes stop_codon:yes gene_type:complete